MTKGTNLFDSQLDLSGVVGPQTKCFLCGLHTYRCPHGGTYKSELVYSQRIKEALHLHCMFQALNNLSLIAGRIEGRTEGRGPAKPGRARREQGLNTEPDTTVDDEEADSILATNLVGILRKELHLHNGFDSCTFCGRYNGDGPHLTPREVDANGGRSGGGSWMYRLEWNTLLESYAHAGCIHLYAGGDRIHPERAGRGVKRLVAAQIDPATAFDSLLKSPMGIGTDTTAEIENEIEKGEST